MKELPDASLSVMEDTGSRVDVMVEQVDSGYAVSCLGDGHWWLRGDGLRMIVMEGR